MEHSLQQQIQQIISAACKEHQVEPVELIVRGSEQKPVIELFVDGVEAVTFELCTELSRNLNERFESVFSESVQYRLDVSSPGVSRPLQFAWQYPKHCGRTLEVHRNDASVIKGVLQTCSDTGIVLLPEKTKNKKNAANAEQHAEIPFSEILKAIVVPQW